MKIEQIYTGCLAQGAYYIVSNGEAAIIDPLREIKPYLERIEADGVKLKYIFETHFHADFVSGHVTLSKQTAAPIIYGPTAEPDFEAIIAQDNQAFQVGDISIIALHTPGHTMESTTYLLKDEQGKDTAIFSGDTLFLGDVGRPDLAQGNGLTTEDLAAILYDSLRNKIMPLADDVTVYPGHGAGSACGKNMSKETVDTLGHQKKTNYALRPDMRKEEFIREVTAGIPAPPAYFPMNVQLNKSGYDDIDIVLDNGLKKLKPTAFKNLVEQKEALVLDVRSPVAFAQGHIPNSIFVGLKGGFAPWVGTVIGDVKMPLLLVAEPGDEVEAVTRLARVGFDQVLGFLENGFDAWKEIQYDWDTVKSIDAETLATIHKSEDIAIYDVRKEGEYEAQHVPNAHFTPLSNINQFISLFPKEKQFYVYCQGGYRSMIAASILKQRGYHNLINIQGGFNDIVKTGLTTQATCTTTRNEK